MILVVISFLLFFVGASFSSTNNNSFRKKVEFCNDHPSNSARLFLRVKYHELEYAMFVDHIPAHQCEKLDAIVNGKYLIRTSAFDGPPLLSTVGAILVEEWFVS